MRCAQHGKGADSTQSRLDYVTELNFLCRQIECKQ
jgi:hypothetical protein